jgi:hypothetical protein
MRVYGSNGCKSHVDQGACGTDGHGPQDAGYGAPAEAWLLMIFLFRPISLFTNKFVTELAHDIRFAQVKQQPNLLLYIQVKKMGIPV